MQPWCNGGVADDIFLHKIQVNLIMNPRTNSGLRHLFSVLFLSLFSVGVFAETSIAILDFELKDLTLAPRIPAEIERTAGIKSMLEGEFVVVNFFRTLG